MPVTHAGRARGAGRGWGTTARAAVCYPEKKVTHLDLDLAQDPNLIRIQIRIWLALVHNVARDLGHSRHLCYLYRGHPTPNLIHQASSQGS